MPALLTLLMLAGAPPPLGALEPLRDYVGHCWVADLPGQATDRHCFRAVYGGKHVRDEHVVVHDGAAVYSGESLYSDEGGEITFAYWNSLGGVGRGFARAAGEDLTFKLRMRAAPAAAPDDVVTIWRRTGVGYEAITAGVTRRFTLDDRPDPAPGPAPGPRPGRR